MPWCACGRYLPAAATSIFDHMPKRPDTRETVLFALELLKRIPRNRKISAPELHQQLADTDVARDLRTIQRQLEMLAEHFDIERDESSKPYGYRWKERAHGLSLPTLTPQESLLLMLAEQHLKSLLPAGLMKSMEGFFRQAHTNLAPHANARLEREWLSKVRVVSTTQPLLPPKVKPEVFKTVSNALYANHWLRLDYRNAEGKQATINVMPLGLAQQGQRVYLVCRYEGYDNERSLALHRIQATEDTGLTFERPLEFDLRKYDDDGRFAFGEGTRIKLKFRIAKPEGSYLLESPLSADQQMKDVGNAYEVEASVVESEHLKKWLRGFGCAVSNANINL